MILWICVSLQYFLLPFSSIQGLNITSYTFVLCRNVKKTKIATTGEGVLRFNSVIFFRKPVVKPGYQIRVQSSSEVTVYFMYISVLNLRRAICTAPLLAVNTVFPLQLSQHWLLTNRVWRISIYGILLFIWNRTPKVLTLKNDKSRILILFSYAKQWLNIFLHCNFRFRCCMQNTDNSAKYSRLNMIQFSVTNFSCRVLSWMATWFWLRWYLKSFQLMAK